MPIYWNTLSWEAFATLAAGLAATGAAAVVGWRQVGVADRQARIIDRQVDLDELKLRSELFGRRFAVYEATHSFARAILSGAREPEREVTYQFLTAKDQSRFLFRTQVHARLEKLWVDATQFFTVVAEMAESYARTGDYGAENIRRKHDYLVSLSHQLSSLSELFGAELRLSDEHLDGRG